VSLKQAQELLGTSASQAVGQVVEAVAAGDLAAGLREINSAVDGGADPRQLARQVVDYLRDLMLVRMGNAALVEAGAEVRATMARQAERLDVPVLLRAIRAFNTAANDARGGWQPQLPLELAMVECVTTPLPAAAPAEAARPAPVAPAAARAAPERAAVTPARPAPSEPAAGSERLAAPPRGGAPTAGPAPVKKPAAPAAATPAASAEPPAGGRGLADLKGDWSRLIKLMRETDKMTEALLHSCTVLGLEGQVLRLSTNEFVYKKIANDATTREKIESRLSEVMGFACGIKLEVAGQRGPAARTEDIPEDGLVATALDLGGEIIDE
jgi:DNA polymerase-3 subunit gamma/tau